MKIEQKKLILNEFKEKNGFPSAKTRKLKGLNDISADIYFFKRKISKVSNNIDIVNENNSNLNNSLDEISKIKNNLTKRAQNLKNKNLLPINFIKKN